MKDAENKQNDDGSVTVLLKEDGVVVRGILTPGLDEATALGDKWRAGEYQLLTE